MSPRKPHRAVPATEEPAAPDRFDIGERLREILVEERLVTGAVVLAALRHQLRSRLDRLFELRGVQLRFHVARPVTAAARVA